MEGNSWRDARWHGENVARGREGGGEIMGTSALATPDRSGSARSWVSSRRRRRVVCGLGGMGRFRVGPAAVSVSGRRLRTGQLEVLTRSPYAVRKRVGSRAQLWAVASSCCRLPSLGRSPPSTGFGFGFACSRACGRTLRRGLRDFSPKSEMCTRGPLTVRRLLCDS